LSGVVGGRGRLPEYLSTLASAGVLLVTVWQDVSQIKKAYGDHAGSILSNSRHVLVFGGSQDVATLDWVRQILGDEAANTTSATSNTGELLNGSVSASQQLVPLTPGNVLREMPHTHALLISANNRPVEVRHIPEHTVDTFKPLRHWPYPATSTLGLPTIGPNTGDSAPHGYADLYNTERHAAAHQLAALFASPTARAIASLHALARLWPGRRRYRPGNTSGGGSTTTHRPQPNRRTAPMTSQPGSRPQRTRATVSSSLAAANRDLGQITEREGGRLSPRQTNPTDDHPTTVIETAGIEHLL
jgi:hypothetical protein